MPGSGLARILRLLLASPRSTTWTSEFNGFIFRQMRYVVLH
jgi:hypothetical protein